MNLHHTYHLYADGDWQACWTEHVKALSNGLLDVLSSFSVGIVGSPEKRKEAIDIVASVGASVVVEKNTGFEQETLDWLDSFVDRYHGYMLYTHSKGAGFPSSISVPWRRMLTFDMVVNWRSCVHFLTEGADCVGSNWHPSGPEYGPIPYFAGNFWWATHSFLRTLPAPSRENRYGAEGWIGSGGKVNPHPVRLGTFPPPVLYEEWLYV